MFCGVGKMLYLCLQKTEKDMKRCLFLLGAVCMMNMTLLADSPLTSTHFWKIYSVDEGANYFPPYRLVDEFDWSDEVKAYLCSEDVPLEQRLCVVNYLGWDFNGQSHWRSLENYYIQHNERVNPEDVYAGMSGELMIVFAYVKAMDDYFDVKLANSMASVAARRSPKSRAVAMIAALIGAQEAMDSEWKEVYRLCHEVEIDTSLNNDFCDAAVWAIMSYINLYAE